MPGGVSERHAQARRYSDILTNELIHSGCLKSVVLFRIGEFSKGSGEGVFRLKKERKEISAGINFKHATMRILSPYTRPSL